MESLKIEQCLLLVGVVFEHRLAMQLTIGARVCIGAGGEQVGGDVADSGNVGDDLDLFVDVGKLGKELGLRVALQNLFCERVTTSMGLGETLHVGLVEEHLGLQHVSGLTSDRFVVAEHQIEQRIDRRATLHVRELFEGLIGGDLLNGASTGDDILEECSLEVCSGGGTGQYVRAEEPQAVVAVLAVRILDVADDLGEQVGAVDGLGVQAVFFTLFDLGEVLVVQSHVCRSRLTRG